MRRGLRSLLYRVDHSALLRQIRSCLCDFSLRILCISLATSVTLTCGGHKATYGGFGQSSCKYFRRRMAYVDWLRILHIFRISAPMQLFQASDLQLLFGGSFTQNRTYARWSTLRTGSAASLDCFLFRHRATVASKVNHADSINPQDNAAQS